MCEIATDKEIDYVFSLRYFNFVKKLQLTIGLWPYHSSCWKIFVKIFLYLLLFSSMIPFSNGCRVWCGADLSMCGTNIITILYTLAVFTKYFCMSLSEKKLKKIYEQIAKNWLSVTDPEEYAIMMKYAKIGKVYSMGYIVYLTVATVSFSQLPTIPVLLDVFFPLNQSRPKILIIKGEFIIDPFEHYVKLYIYFLVGSVITILVFMGTDTTFCIIVHQILGIMSITKRRLHNATTSVEIKKGNSYDIIITAISLHQESISFVGMIEATFTECFLFIVVGITVFISLIITISLNSEIIYDSIRGILIGIGAIIQIFYLSLNAQKIVDCSNDLCTNYDTDWYNIPPKSKNLLKFMILRTAKPLFLTAGGFYVMSIHNFGIILKTAVSYVTVLSSFK